MKDFASEVDVLRYQYVKDGGNPVAFDWAVVAVVVMDAIEQYATATPRKP